MSRKDARKSIALPLDPRSLAALRRLRGRGSLADVVRRAAQRVDLEALRPIPRPTVVARTLAVQLPAALCLRIEQAARAHNCTPADLLRAVVAQLADQAL